MTRHLHLQTLLAAGILVLGCTKAAPDADGCERTTIGQSLYAANWWTYEFWRFVFVQQEVAKIQKAMNASVGK